MNFFCISDRESSAGFKLLNIRTAEVSTREEILSVLEAAVSDAETGIILITEKAAALAQSEISRFVRETAGPLVLEIPSRKPPQPAKSDV